MSRKWNGILSIAIVFIALITVTSFVSAAELKIDLPENNSRHYDPSHIGHSHQCANCQRTYNQPGDNGPYSSGNYRCPYCGFQNQVPPTPNPYNPPQPPYNPPQPPYNPPYNPPVPYPPTPQYETDVTLYNAAYSYFNNGNYGLAIKFFKRLADNYPNSSYREGAMFYIAMSHKNTYNYSGAIKTLQIMINDYKYSANRINWFFAIGEVCEAAVKFADAAKWYQGVIREYPAHPRAPEALYRSGQNFEKAYKNREAAAAYRQLTASYPYTPFAQSARERLAALGFGY